jgi:hypothetical protein
MSNLHQNIDSGNDHPEIPYREEYADAALSQYNKARRLHRILKFSSAALVLLFTGIGVAYFTSTRVNDSLTELQQNEGFKSDEQPVTTRAGQLSEIIDNTLPKDSPGDISKEEKNNSKKIIPTPKDLKTPFVIENKEGSELENPAVGLSVAVSSGVVTSERQPVLFAIEESPRSESISNDNSSRPMQLKSAPLISQLPSRELNLNKRALPLAASRLKPYFTLGVGGYSTLGLARFKDPSLSVGFDYIKSGYILYAAVRGYSITGLNNPYVSSQKTYTDVSHETRTTYQTDKLYMAGIDVGAGHRLGAYLLKAGIVADYMITGKNTLTQEKLINNEIISSHSSTDNGYVEGFRDLSFAANLGISRQLSSSISAGASIQFGMHDITRNDVFKSGDRHLNSVAQLFLKYQWQR